MKFLLSGIGETLKALQVALLGLGAVGILLIAFLDAGMLPLPGGPDAVVMTLSHLNHHLMPLYVAAAVVGSTLGCLIPYYLGRKTGAAALRRFDPARIAKVSRLLDQYDLGCVLVGALLPPPFPLKLFLITAGVFRMNVWRFLLALALGRTVRYSLEGWMAVQYGEQAADLFRAHYPWIGLGLALTILVGFLLNRYLHFRKQRFGTS
jgi:membrane protein YqaA with SNARE-associated domain